MSGELPTFHFDPNDFRFRKPLRDRSTRPDWIPNVGDLVRYYPDAEEREDLRALYNLPEESVVVRVTLTDESRSKIEAQLLENESHLFCDYLSRFRPISPLEALGLQSGE